MKKQFLNNIRQYIFTALLGLCFYFVLFLPIEYYLTEIQFSISKVPPVINTVILFLFLLIANLFNIKNLVNEKRKTVLVALFFLISFVCYGYYHQVKLSREYLPKIIKVSPTRFIQGEFIEIDGTNFGPTYNKGKVIINETEFIAKDWNDNKIIIESPVPDKFGTYYLYVKTKEGKISNQIPIEILNPDYLRQN